MPLVIDSDAHVLEGPTFFAEALKRWPGHLRVSGGERPAIVVESPVLGAPTLEVVP